MLLLLLVFLAVAVVIIAIVAVAAAATAAAAAVLIPVLFRFFFGCTGHPILRAIHLYLFRSLSTLCIMPFYVVH